MKPIRMKKYVDEDGNLKEIEDALFIRERVAKSDSLYDFDGVGWVCPDFLEELFKDFPEHPVNQISGLPRSGPEAEEQEARTAPALEAPTAPTNRFTPFRLEQELHHRLASYFQAAYPLSDPALVRERKKLLEDQELRLLAQEPYIESTPKYKVFEDGFSQLKIPEPEKRFLETLSQTPRSAKSEETILYPGLYEHQAQAIEEFMSEGKNLVVSTGTGSGKTECFLIPMVTQLLREARTAPTEFAKRRVRAIVLYPMNALVNDQLARLRLLFGSENFADLFRQEAPAQRHPTFGRYTSRTPYPGPRSASKDKERVGELLSHYINLEPQIRSRLESMGHLPAKALSEFYAEELKNTTVDQSGKERNQYNWKQRLHTHPSDRELFTRHEMIPGPDGSGNPPDILVTNYSMLEYMLTRPWEKPLFDQTAAALADSDETFLLVLDEAHMYRGSKGAEVGLLVRRLAHRLGLSENSPRFRVICTSASLGTGEKALQTAKNFVADLTGVAPSSVSVIRSTIVHQETTSPNPEKDVAAFSAISVESIHQANALEELKSALQPLLTSLDLKAVDIRSETELWQILYNRLLDRPYVCQLLAATSGTAVPLSKLATKVFPGSKTAEQALSTLLTIGSLARPSENAAGLIPARVHLMFRGLNGLYACLNTRCDQSNPDSRCLGKLFPEPREFCDCCGSRVAELLSCHNCGEAFVQAYHSSENMRDFEFLWGECEDGAYPVQLRLGDVPEEAHAICGAFQLDTRSGFLERTSSEGNSNMRTAYLPKDNNGRLTPLFSRCPCCQATEPQTRAKIRGFRTFGEEPFTKLVEAQFSEQPPMSEVRPNRGRKVLIFSDGRQKAARLAGALESHHSETAFRQSLFLVIDHARAELGGDELELQKLMPAMIHYCSHNGINLFPENEQFLNLMKRARHWTLKNALENVSQLFSEFGIALTPHLCHKFFSLQALGMTKTVWSSKLDYLIDPLELEVSASDKKILVNLWLRSLLENRSFLPINCSPLQFDIFERPDGIDLSKPHSLIPKRLENFILKVLNRQALESFRSWASNVVTNEGLFHYLDNRFYLQTSPLALKNSFREIWYCCTTCSTLYYESLKETCAYCCGSLEPVEEDYLFARTGFYRDQIDRASQVGSCEPFGLSLAEHSAQLTGSDLGETVHTHTELSEMRFQDIPVKSASGLPLAPIDVLSCTTTMEVGIDIGNLTGVALRNVPPSVASYQQRAGRAGRRGRALASVITYAQGSSHDTHFFQSPSDIICGEVREPIVYIENRRILGRHINAEILRLFFQKHSLDPAESASLFTSLGTVKEFLGTGSHSWTELRQWTQENEDLIVSNLTQWLPTKGHQLGESIDVQALASHASSELLKGLEDILPLALLEKQNRGELDRFEEDALNFQLKETLLKFLIDAAILPRYAFPTDVVSFWVPNLHGSPGQGSYEYSPQRDLQIALSEYAPGRSLTIDKQRFISAGFFSPYQPDPSKLLKDTEHYYSCHSCGYMKMSGTSLSDDQCPACREGQLVGRNLLRPQGFAPDINQKRKQESGQGVTYAGFATPAQLEVGDVQRWDSELFESRVSLLAGPQELVVVNKGVNNDGFRVCPRCGRAEPEAAQRGMKRTLASSNRSHRHPLEGTDCRGKPRGPFYLGHKFPTDVLLLRLNFIAPFRCLLNGDVGKAGRAGLASLVESLCLVASRVLQIDEGELAGNWAPVVGSSNTKADIFFYDQLPGGAGYGRLFADNLTQVLQEAVRVLSECTCQKSCYQCIRHYRNRQQHALLDRHLALALLKYILHGTTPRFDLERVRSNLKALSSSFPQDVRISQVAEDGCFDFIKGSDKRPVRVHHPFVQPDPGEQLCIDQYILCTAPPTAKNLFLGKAAPKPTKSENQQPPGFALADPSCRELAEEMVRLKLPIPEIGYDFKDCKRVVGELEFAWLEEKTGLALSDEVKKAVSSLDAGWTVFNLEEKEQLIDHLCSQHPQ